MDPIRIGKIGTVNEKTGMVSVVYTDRGGETTDEMPMLCPGGIWKKPEIGTMVLVNAMSNGGDLAIVVGPYSNEFNSPIDGASWNCLFGSDKDKNFISYDEKTETLTVNCKNIKIVGSVEGG